MASSPTRVLLVDDHQLLTDSLARLLAAEPDIEVVGIAASVAETRRLASPAMDVVLMDYRLPDGTGRGRHAHRQGPLADLPGW